MDTICVAIDGPSGAGKSTLARAAAAALKFLYVDTGAIYRTVALCALDNGADLADEAAILSLLHSNQIEIQYNETGEQRMFLNGQDVSERIRLPKISQNTSAVAVLSKVRNALLEIQRAPSRENNVIMDGRDIGTVVLPDAEIKIFLTASAQVRAERRFREFEMRGTPEPFEKVLKDIEDRDYRDTHRAVAPLRQAEDAVVLDTSALDFQESLEALLGVIRERTSV